MRSVSTLIACISCAARPAHRAAQRNTWARDVSGDVRFFVGRDAEPDGDDVVVLDADDSYNGLPQKTRALAHWALAHGYEQVFKVNDDVLVVPQRLCMPPLEVPIAGWLQEDDTWVHGHAYWIRPTALRLCAEAPLPAVLDKSVQVEDRWLSALLVAAGIPLRADNGIAQFQRAEHERPFDLKATVARFEQLPVYAVAEFGPQEMRAVYAAVGRRYVPTVVAPGPVQVWRPLALRRQGWETVSVPEHGNFLFHDGGGMYDVSVAQVLVEHGAATYATNQDVIELRGVAVDG